MKDFFREKISFSLTLLAVLFAMNPIITEYGSVYYLLFDLKLSISTCYYMTLGVLGVSVYLYSFDMISDKPSYFFQKLGNWIYTVALFIPLLFFLLWIITLISKLKFLQSAFSQNIVIIILSVALTLIIQNYMRKVINILGIRDKKMVSNQLADNELKSIENASKLLGLDLFSASIVESFSGLEYSVKKVLNDNNIKYDKGSIKLFDLAISLGVIPDKYKDDIVLIRDLRNKAAHPSNEVIITKNDAENVLNKVKNIFIELSKNEKHNNE